MTAGFGIGGGVPTVARWLCDGLRSLGGYSVDVHDLATSSRDPFSRRLRAPRSWVSPTLCGASGDGVIHWGANAVEIETMRYRPRRELTRALSNYDLIQIVSGGPALAGAVTQAGVPSVLQVASTVAWERERQQREQTGLTGLWRRGMTALTTRVERQALSKVDVVLVENAAMLDYVLSMGHKRVTKVFPGVDIGVFSPPTSGWNREGHLLSVCRLDDPRKGLDRMIRAYAYMVETDDSVPRLLLAGRGRLPEAVHALIARLGIPTRVTVCSDVSGSALPELYRGASIYLQTSYEEGLGMSVLEAMASGLPVVSTETAGTRETVVDGVTGWLIPQDGDLDVVRKVASRALDVLHGIGSTLGANGRGRCITTFSSHVAIRRFTATYDQLLARGGTARPAHLNGAADGPPRDMG